TYPPDDERILYAGEQKPEFLLEAGLTYPAERRPFEAVVVLNGEPLRDRPAVDEKSGKLTARIPLQAGENRIQIRLHNAWREVSTPDPPVALRSLPPPRVVEVTASKPRKLQVDIAARVVSASALKPVVELSDGPERRLLTAELTPPDKQAGEAA